ncbi:DUF2332 domain-containing protein [Candidatus Blastococcus massiliensis]|uniref:DUF2332 domain-containing protein n=1 Tax=Candidatus Blastococcus massiliensis TaxID=1470358 RepID=UPI0004B89B16|nr:DUF2332 domain-containing protein [Candidatus Blastococcus massiliensis]
MPSTVAEVFREHADHPAERGSPLMQALLLGAAEDWDADGITRAVLDPYADDPPGSALPLRFAAALHRLVLTGQAAELAAHYPTVGGTEAPELAWHPARRVLERETDQVRELTGLPCQTNEVGRTVPLLVGLAEVAHRTGGRPLRLLEIGASAGLNLLVDRFRFGDVRGPPDSPCRLPAPGLDLDTTGLRIAERAGCDRAPLDPGDEEARLRLTASVWGDQVDRFRRLRGALAVAESYRVPVEPAGAAEWLTHRLAATHTQDTAVPVVWHSIVRSYVDPGEWQQVEELTAGVWRLSYEPDPGPNPRGVPLRLFCPGTDPGGEVLVHGTGHGPPLSPAARP